MEKNELVIVRNKQGGVLFRTPYVEIKALGIEPTRNDWGELETTVEVVWDAVYRRNVEKCRGQSSE